MAKETWVEHPFEPIFSSTSKVLILGSLPSVASREQAFYYGHPRNRFWKVLAEIFQDEVPISVDQKKNFLLKHHIALWDVIAKCKIQGSSDSSIKEATPNDLSLIFRQAPIERVLCNGTTAYKLYHQFQEPLTHLQAECLPSTSPANASWSLEKLIEKWQPYILDEDKKTS